jgi:DegV family protein with EDD domain
MGEGLFVHKALQLQQSGMGYDEVVTWLEEHKQNFCHYFTVDDLFHLYRGGRVSKTAAVLGTMINLKPILHVDAEGHLIPVAKVRGRKKSLAALVDRMEQQIGSWRDKNDIVFISHGDCLDDALYIQELVKKRFGIEKFLISPVGPTIGAHSGPGTLALFFMGETR